MEEKCPVCGSETTWDYTWHSGYIDSCTECGWDDDKDPDVFYENMTDTEKERVKDLQKR